MLSDIPIVARPSPINRLPHELLSYIFILTTYAGRDPSQVRDVVDCQAALDFYSPAELLPLTLSSVNKHWRRAAYTTPRLWTSISITTSDVYITNAPRKAVDLKDAKSMLDIRHINKYLALSKSAPLDILLDVRDPDWYYADETGEWIQALFQAGLYFSPGHTRAAIQLLLQHLPRWRTIAVVTDTWLHMQVVLSEINTFCLERTRELSATESNPINLAPQLESIMLLRSVMLEEDVDLQEALTLDPDSQCLLTLTEANVVLPKLSKLVLSGPHMNWGLLPRLLKPVGRTHTTLGLTTLDLSYHMEQIRPKLRHFRRLLEACPGLERLTLNVSGPRWDVLADEDSDMDTDSDSDHSDDSVDDFLDDEGDRLERVGLYAPIQLPNLRFFSIGYVSVERAIRLLRLIEARDVVELRVEDSTHPNSARVQEAGDLIQYLAIGEHAMNDRITWLERHAHGQAHPVPFPVVEHLVLYRVQTRSPAPLRLLYSNLPALKTLYIGHCSRSTIWSLRPLTAQTVKCRACLVPVQKLKFLTVAGMMEETDLVKKMREERRANGARIKTLKLDKREDRRTWNGEMLATAIALHDQNGVYMGGTDSGPEGQDFTVPALTFAGDA